MKNYVNELISQSKELYTIDGYVAVLVSSFKISLLEEDPQWFHPVIYFREKLYGGVGKILQEYRKGAPIFLFQMLVDKPGPHDQGIYIPPSIVNNGIISLQRPFRFSGNDSTGMIDTILVSTKVKAAWGYKNPHELVQTFEKRLGPKLQTLYPQ